MSTEAALLRAIREDPDDDTTRLVYADFVEEEGDPARGEFVRVQIALARTPHSDPSRHALEDRENQLLAGNEPRWLGVPPDCDGLNEWEFARGFVHEVAATPSFMLNEGADLCAAHPVARWRVQCTQQDMGEDLRQVGQRGWFSRLQAVDLAGWFEALGELERFLTRSDFARLRELDLHERPGLDELPAILERAPFREQLKVLRVGSNYAGGAGVFDVWELARVLNRTRLAELSVPGCMLAAEDIRALLAGDCCDDLLSLDIRDNPIEPDGWDAFRVVRLCLRELDLSGTPLGAIALEDVLRQPSLADLRALHLNRCGSAMANVRALAASRYWTQAEELRMQAGTVPENALEPLFTSAGSPGLRVLDVSENFFRAAGVRGLCSARWIDSLEWLGLSRNYLTDDALCAIAECGRFTRLRTLHLAGNNHHNQQGADYEDRLTDAGLRALAECSGLANLRVLTVSATAATAAGIEALLNGPHWRLTGLGLAECDVLPDSVFALANSPALARLDWLDLGGHRRLGGDALMPLAESPYLSPLCELDIRGCYADEATRAAFRERLGRRLSE